MLDPRSGLLRSGCIVMVFISVFIFLLSVIIYTTTGLRYLSPGADDMGGEGDWAELMMDGSLLLPLLTNAFFARPGIFKLKQPLHLAYFIGLDLFVCLFLLGIWHTSLFMSHFVLSTGCDYPSGKGYETTDFFCHPSFEICRGLFIAGYAFALILALVHGVFFAVAARKLDLENRAKRRECLGRGVDIEDEIELM